MKKLMVALMMLAIASFAGAQTLNSWIGMFDNNVGDQICYGDVVTGTPTVVYFGAVVDEGEFPYGITAAEFRVENLPPNDYAQGGLITYTWTSEVVVGDLDWDFSIAWSAPQAGAFVLIGQGDFLQLADGWVGDDHVMEVMAGNTCECLVLVDDQFVARDVIGGEFTWNCTGECLCIWVTAAEESSWTEVKSLY